ncbi:hypothetical protein DOTSEDRAFT_51495 [Dothistroma septosporum NZE10]|uniref:[histone H3]-trimethyl-L-lysine(9) demethylase n=1 Tax=Dothistroma septosporum (strain NZE10 / CBS 128990) TaxID=675120 RepID=N1PXN9_DOTSN|nr:hypothetical protein DOTSEDRAFT_51495 [Dothistroma septosporum NZE10]
MAAASVTAGVMPPSPEGHDGTKPLETTESVATAALTPPTSEDMNDAKKDSDESDLSDLDLDDEDEEITPDHYWDEENGGRIPVFKPTMDQFRDFKKFMEKIDKYGMKSGIVKVVPPPDWRNSLPALDEYVKRIRIKNPITQEFNGTFGTYTQQNVEKQRSYNLPEWKALTEETQYQHPAKRGERRRNQEKVVRGGGTLRGRGAAAPVGDEDEGNSRPKRRPGRPRRNPAPEHESEDEAKDVKPARKKPGRPSKGGQAKSVSSRRLNNTTETVDYVDEKAFKKFNYRMEGLNEYTKERCQELETHYWKSLGFNQPMYAADMPGSLFDDTTTSWNVAKLPNLLDILGTKVPGVNTAYLYMGMWKATFAWHLEDVDLYSINYIHFGAPKQWYSISQEDARKFERAMKQIWPVDAKNCDQFLRHKTYLISPDVLQKQYGVKVNKLVHYEGEFVITFPYGYHSGYNIGYNCAESVNFATESWLEFGRIARKCNCESDNVWVDVGEIERKLRGEPTPEYYEETDDEDDLSGDEETHLPTPPASVKGKPATKKRKRETKKEEPKKKKKIRIKIRVSGREPCCMCPNDNPWEELLPTDTGKKAHRSCAAYTPETFIVSEDGKDKVCGVSNIDKARLELKCNFCRSKRGACFQCCSKKCTRAFHATCAVAAGVLVDGGLVPTFAEDGTEYYEEGFDFRCKYHRPKQAKNCTVDDLESNGMIIKMAKDLRANDTVQAQMIGGEAFGGLVIENRPAEMTVLVAILPDGNRVELEYKYMLVLHPDDSVRPKPSAAAKPMPENMSKSNFSISNRQDGVPSQEEPFHDNPEFKWWDFYNYHTPPPGYQTVPFKASLKYKIDVNAPEIYYYLPGVSTEAKVFFTDKPGSQEITAKANFMDRVSVKQPTFQYNASATKQAIAPANVNSFSRIQPNNNPNTPTGARNEKPYVYKPKESVRPNVLCAVDYQALANQRNFVADGNRRPSAYSQASQPPLQQQFSHSPAQHGYQSSDGSRNSTPLRSFPSDQYYSSKVLPAAYQGEYSRFRRESQGAQTLQRPVFEPAGYTPNYQSVSAQRNALKQASATPAPMPPNPYAPIAAMRPSSAALSHSPPAGAPLTPATTTSSHSRTDHVKTDPDYLEDLQKYPYLLNSFCRRQKTYESPYSMGGGFATNWQPLELQKSDEQSRSASHHTPRNSISSLNEAQPNSQQWTPPSQVWDRAGIKQRAPLAQLVPQVQPQLYQEVGPRNFPPAIHQTPQDFQRQILGMPSTASRDGAHARMLRDQGYLSYAAQHNQHRRNSFGQAYDTAKMWNSPQAPTPSPLSDPNITPGQGRGHTPTNSGHWGMLPRTEGMNNRGSGAGYGPMLPQMGGNETWRYN